MPSKRILTLDDNVLFVQILSDLLTFEDFEVIAIHQNGDAVDRIVAEHQPDLILMDIHMPGLDGRELSRQLKQQPSTQHIAIILMSGTVDLDEALKASGADAVLSKPFAIDDLLVIIHRLFGT